MHGQQSIGGRPENSGHRSDRVPRRAPSSASACRPRSRAPAGEVEPDPRRVASRAGAQMSKRAATRHRWRLAGTIARADAEGVPLLAPRRERLGLSARALAPHASRRRTLADLDGSAAVRRLHIAEALSYRRPQAACLDGGITTRTGDGTSSFRRCRSAVSVGPCRITYSSAHPRCSPASLIVALTMSGRWSSDDRAAGRRVPTLKTPPSRSTGCQASLIWRGRSVVILPRFRVIARTAISAASDTSRRITNCSKAGATCRAAFGPRCVRRSTDWTPIRPGGRSLPSCVRWRRSVWRRCAVQVARG